MTNPNHGSDPKTLRNHEKFSCKKVGERKEPFYFLFFTFSALASLLQKVEKERELNGADLCNPLQGTHITRNFNQFSQMMWICFKAQSLYLNCVVGVHSARHAEKMSV